MKPTHRGRFHYNGQHYDMIHRDLTEDIPFWIGQARKYGSPALELACGTGRVTLLLANAGFEVTGIDFSDSMLAQARDKASQQGINVEWIKADVRNFDLGRKFPLVIFPFRSIAELHTLRDLEACLSCVKRHLSPEAGFIIDAFNPSLDILNRNPKEKHPFAQYPDPDGKGTVIVTHSNVYDAATQVNTITLFYKLPGRTEEATEELAMRMHFPQELEALLHYNGFKIEAKYGDYDETPFTPSANVQLTVCSLRE
ncbi:MAG: class I SAM-dependent methyltransferase [Dehalococcoidia bacterium]